ncbi:TilS substrate-binding domain-containing protein [Burkholderia sp. AU38729]|uniref:TilS substrate-binding domain-containing protein n=1 Tax=Burkholderia sp. AU38729 TaxID=2879633 RepID=UPI001CF38334|nr:TilS substrate-binding domain-containing protein [Burkholderia sp. AU38729]
MADAERAGEAERHDDGADAGEGVDRGFHAASPVRRPNALRHASASAGSPSRPSMRRRAHMAEHWRSVIGTAPAASACSRLLFAMSKCSAASPEC